MLIERGITIIDNSNPKTEFQCEFGHSWLASYRSVIKGSGCPYCAGNAPLSKNVVNDRLGNRDVKMTGEYINARTKSNFQCSLGHKWLAIPQSIMNGKGCPDCAKLSNIVINERLFSRHIQIVGPYVNNYTKADFECELGHIWSAVPNNILNGSGCPLCAVYGFTPSKPAWEYIFIRDNYLKYGITNYLDKRLNQHRRNGEIILVHQKYHENGQKALDWENYIKTKIGGKYVTKDICQDGWTETLSLDKLNILLEIVL